MSLNSVTKYPFIGLIFLLFIIMAIGPSGCAGKRQEQPAVPIQKLNAMLMAELALKRNQYPEAYAYFDEAIEAGLAATDFIEILASLRGTQHAEYRTKVTAQWYRQHPDNLLALKARSRELVCNNPKEAPAELIRLARLLKDKSQLNNVLDCLEPAPKAQLLADISEEINAPNVQLLLCQTLAEQEQHDQVLNCIRDISISEHTPEILRLQAQSLVALGQLPAAEQTFLKLLENNPTDSDSRYELASLYYQKNHYSQAIEQLQILLETEPNNRNIHYLLASSYFSDKQYEQSKVWFEELLKVRRYRNSALYYLGMIAIDMEQPDQAMGYLDSITESEFYLPAQLNLWRLISDSDTELAIEGLYQLIEALPRERMTIKLAQIDILEKAGEDQRATQEVVSLADDYPTHLRLQILRLQWLIDRDYLDKLTANMSASIAGLQDVSEQLQLVENTVFYLIDQQLGPSATDILTNQTVIASDTDQYRYLFALASILSNNFEPGLAALEKLVQASPNSLDYKNALAYSMILANSRLEEAEQLLLEILEQEPENAAFLDSIGWLYFNMGQYEKAGEFLIRANSKVASASIKAHLIEYYLQQGDYAQARKLLIEATSLFPRHKVLSKFANVTELQKTVH